MDLHEFTVILDEPLYPINLGYIARVMANLGFEDLRLVRPRAAIDEWSISMSMDGRPILENATAYESFEEAIADCAVTVATTRRIGKRKVAVMTPEEVALALLGFDKKGKIGIVFGSEDRGLSNEQVQRCTLTLTIPGVPGKDSFNLSHAVAIVLYALRSAQLNYQPRDRARAREIEGFLEHMKRVLELSGFLAADDPLRAMAKMRALLYRGRASHGDIGLLHALIDHLARIQGIKEQLNAPSIHSNNASSEEKP